MKFVSSIKCQAQTWLIGGLTCALALSILLSPTIADAKTLRWASKGDVFTMDPHSQNNGLTNDMSDHIYEPLRFEFKRPGFIHEPYFGQLIKQRGRGGAGNYVDC